VAVSVATANAKASGSSPYAQACLLTPSARVHQGDPHRRQDVGTTRPAASLSHEAVARIAVASGRRMSRLLSHVPNCLFGHGLVTVWSRNPGTGGYWPAPRNCESAGQRHSLAFADTLQHPQRSTGGQEVGSSNLPSPTT
jgi:hypothetical protein